MPGCGEQLQKRSAMAIFRAPTKRRRECSLFSSSYTYPQKTLSSLCQTCFWFVESPFYPFFLFKRKKHLYSLPLGRKISKMFLVPGKNGDTLPLSKNADHLLHLKTKVRKLNWVFRFWNPEHISCSKFGWGSLADILNCVKCKIIWMKYYYQEDWVSCDYKSGIQNLLDELI